MFFVFKQKTAYEMRISDWSSDVCSSDLPEVLPQLQRRLCRPADDALGAGAVAQPDDRARGRPDRHGQGGENRKDDGARRISVGARHIAGWGRNARAEAGQRLFDDGERRQRSEEHTSELKSPMRSSYAV